MAWQVNCRAELWPLLAAMQPDALSLMQVCCFHCLSMDAASPTLSRRLKLSAAAACLLTTVAASPAASSNRQPFHVVRSTIAMGHHHPLQIKEDDGEPLQRGTRVTLHLKDDATDLADQKKLEDLIKQYSEFISFPIK